MFGKLRRCDMMTEMPPLFYGDEVPLRYPDGTWIPCSLVFMLAHQDKITLSEARMRLIEAWRGGKGNRAQRRQRKKKCRQ